MERTKEILITSHKKFLFLSTIFYFIPQLRIPKSEIRITMTLQQLKYAIAIADTRNITEASKRVFISQPSLTAAIHELEEEMGVTIFNRSNKGVTITNEGDEFLSYARQVLEQATLMEDRYKGGKGGNTIFSVSCQHYSFAVNAFVDVIRKFGGPSYDFTLRETQTNEIIDDIAKLKSEIGVLYLSDKNEKVIKNSFKRTIWSLNRSLRPLYTCSCLHATHLREKKKSLWRT